MNFQSKTTPASLTALMIGDERLLAECALLWRQAGHEIGAIVTRRSEIADWASGEGFDVILHKGTLSDLELNVAFDWILSIANLRLLPERLLSRASGAVNFHDGPLPSYAGLNAPVWARLNNETGHGITWHLVDQGVDTGDILVERRFDMSEEDTALTLNTKCFAAGLESFPDVIRAIEAGGKPRLAQDTTSRKLYRGSDRPAAFGRVDFNRPAQEVLALVQAMDHGAYWNPLTTTKIAVNGEIFTIQGATRSEGQGDPGQVLSFEGDAARVACGTGAIELLGLRDNSGQEVALGQLLSVGMVLQSPRDPQRLTTAQQAITPHEAYWRKVLRSYNPMRLPLTKTTSDPADWDVLKLDLPKDMAQADVLAVMSLFAKSSGVEAGTQLALTHEGMTQQQGYLAPWIPFDMDAEAEHVDGLKEALHGRFEARSQKNTFALDLVARDPEITPLKTPDIALHFDPDATAIEGAALNVYAADSALRIRYDANRISAGHAERLAARIVWIASQCDDTERPLTEIDPLPAEEKQLLLQRWNDTNVDFDGPDTLHEAIAAQAAKTPEAIATVFEHSSLTYKALDDRANQVAQVLKDAGVVRGDVIGVHCKRGHDLVIACLGILKAGGAYLPLDPGFPADRLAIYVEDSAAKFILSQSAIAAQLPDSSAQVLELDRDARFDAADTAPLAAMSDGKDLAYLIFTSGSTGRPKGVMVEHRNVMNFFAGMDAQISHETPGTWLAVTSLSFDISVLELFYTLARGFKVVIAGDEGAAQISDGPLATPGAGMEFSLYYWGNDDGVGRGKYELLLEGAKIADQNGFCAVWTPERHFHAFGGPYPNPSVTGAAVAAVTRNIGVRAGSCVAPLHHTARIAEEWAVIDNLTNGRAGLAIASGWQPDDFVLRPENTPPANKTAMFEQMGDLRKLWRGEEVSFPRKDGTQHAVVTQPRPVSKELDLWVTTAGNPETWKEAGRNGCHVLTHLLGQSVAEVADKIKIYHAALREAGYDPAKFKVTLMLHTYVAEDRDTAREVARGPMKDYLRSAAGLIKQYAWAFPAFKKPENAKNAFELDLGTLSEEELEGILDYAFLRYFEDSGLFGTVEDCVARAEELKAIGVSEIACLIDYGIAQEQILAALEPLSKVVAACKSTGGVAADDVSIAGQILRHNVSHLQCTPSMARMLVMNDEAAQALSKVQHLMIGGEALSGQLVKDLNTLSDARITNMYGPTETTIWSSTAEAAADEGTVSIGRPIANTGFYALDDAMRPVPLGAAGELYIGGQGVTRGYWQRDDLTEARFVKSPFDPDERLYRTGDLVRARLDGGYDFLGRADHQVKLRGYRIELGEIEQHLEAMADVMQAVVMSREDTPGDLRLVAYVKGTVKVEDMQAHLAGCVPDYMMPSHFVMLDAFPLTPNKKVDRKALSKPAIQQAKPVQAVKAPVVSASAHSAVPEGDLMAQISEVWMRTLGVAQLSRKDNFFDLGGHSLLAVQCHRELRGLPGLSKLSITDIFRFPILGDLVKRARDLGGDVRPAKPNPAQAVPKSAPAPAATPVVESAPHTTNPRSLSRHAAISKRRALREKRKETQL